MQKRRFEKHEDDQFVSDDLGMHIHGGMHRLLRVGTGTLTVMRYRDEILGPIVRPYTGPVGPGFLLGHA